jgi:transcriptional regulator with XRE-family HTH domain
MENTKKIIREIREVFCESQAQFAKRVGTTQPMIARWETGQLPTGDWISRISQIARTAGLDEHADELAGLAKRKRVSPLIELRTEEEVEEVHALLRVLRQREEYESELARVKTHLARARKDNANVMAAFQATKDLRGAMVRLHQRGHKAAEIAEILGGGITEEQVSSYLTMVEMKALLDETRSWTKPVTPRSQAKTRKEKAIES